ncbi:MAG TPA: amidohydrolase family protein [Nocardioidaceae bacterium]|nr:amidohydrolase family protein [Nocardioidaceae bacterium]
MSLSPSLQDVDVPAWWQRLGLPGLFDVHVHFLPERVQAKVWEQFDLGGPLIGRPWPIRYRGTDTERVVRLRALGVRRFSALSYAHRPGMAEFLNDWAADFADRVPECLRSATFFPEDGVGEYVEKRLDAGAEIFKVHVQVGAFDLRDPRLDAVWGLLAEAGTPVVIHAGSGPVGTEFTGPDPMRSVLGRHPRLTAVIAHMGSPEYREFHELAERFPRVHLDTTMIWTTFFEDAAPYPPDLVPRLLDLGDRVLLGSDFPNIPYAYGHQLEVIERLGLGDGWLRAVCWENGSRLFT